MAAYSEEFKIRESGMARLRGLQEGQHARFAARQITQIVIVLTRRHSLLPRAG